MYPYTHTVYACRPLAIGLLHVWACLYLAHSRYVLALDRYAQTMQQRSLAHNGASKRLTVGRRHNHSRSAYEALRRAHSGLEAWLTVEGSHDNTLANVRVNYRKGLFSLEFNERALEISFSF